MKYKLNIDDQEALEELLTSHGWEPLLKVIALLAHDQEQNVIRYDLNQGPEGLVIAKARAEGANLMKLRIKEIKDEVKKQKQKG